MKSHGSSSQSEIHDSDYFNMGELWRLFAGIHSIEETYTHPFVNETRNSMIFLENAYKPLFSIFFQISNQRFSRTWSTIHKIIFPNLRLLFLTVFCFNLSCFCFCSFAFCIACSSAKSSAGGNSSTAQLIQTLEKKITKITNLSSVFCVATF